MGRFETTTRSALEETIRHLGEIDDRATVCRKLRERKLGNIATSIVFGLDDMVYESAVNPLPIAPRPRPMKHTTTHFILGNADLDYETEAKQQDPTGRMGEFTATVDVDDPRVSSCFFGCEDIEYTSTSHAAVNPALLANVRGNEMRAQAIRLKANLAGHNITLGHEHPEYRTTSREAFQYEHDSAQASRGKLFAAQKSDLRRQHFEFGLEPVVYETDAQRSMRFSGEITAQRLVDMKNAKDAAQALKKELLATSVIVGDDQEYMK